MKEFTKLQIAIYDAVAELDAAIARELPRGSRVVVIENEGRRKTRGVVDHVSFGWVRVRLLTSGRLRTVRKHYAYVWREDGR